MTPETLDLYMDLDVPLLEEGCRLVFQGAYTDTDAELFAAFHALFVAQEAAPFRLFYRGMGPTLPAQFAGRIVEYRESQDPHEVHCTLQVVSPVVTETPD